MKKRDITVFGIILLFFCMTMCFHIEVYAEEKKDETEKTNEAERTDTAEKTQKIKKGVFLDSIDVSDMTKEQAIAEVEKSLKGVQGYNIQLHAGDNVVNATAGELGLCWQDDRAVERALAFGQTGNVIKRYKAGEDLQKEPVRLELQYDVDTGKTEKVLAERCLPFDCEPANATMYKEDGEFVIVKEQIGITLNLDESVALVKEYLTRLWREGVGEVELVAEYKEAEHNATGLYQIQDVLSTATTDYSSSSQNRAQNIRNGTAKLDGIVLFPGEEYSVCDAMVPFSEANGYVLGTSYANGTVVESFGGGICQVSTTLYLALLRSELDVTERENHSMIVKYVKPSMDAAISEGAKDLKFKNNLENPIYIEAYTDGGEVGFTVYGKEYRPEGREVVYESETVETTPPTVELTASDEPFGSIEQTDAPYTGYVAKLWKVVTENGEETRTQVNDSTYQMQPTKYAVGTVTDSSEAKSAIYDAIEKNDLDAAYSAINNYG